MGRPKSATKKTEAVQIRLSTEELDNFGRLVESRAEELRNEGVDVTPPMVIRWLIAREVAARGLDKASAPQGSKGVQRGAQSETAEPSRARKRG